jgi:hypothetical protein
MPGLIRGMARTAAVVGTATATRNAVNRRQADKNYAAYEHAAQQAAPPPQQAAPPPQQAAPAAPPPDQYYEAPAQQVDVITQLERLGALKQQGLLTDAEFEAEKKKLLGL